MLIEYSDLTPLARTYLGVIAAGLVPARLAQDDRLRLDYVAAVCHALSNGDGAETHLEGDGPQPRDAFLDELRTVIADLDVKGIVIAGAGDGQVATMPFLDQTMGPLTAAQIAKLDLNQPPRLLDRYLAYKALDDLLAVPEVYDFLMEKYSVSTEIWQRLMSEGYGR